MRQCVSCGAELSGSERFCSACGRAVTDQVPEATSKVAPNEAREIIEAVRSGVVPRSKVAIYSVGRERHQKALADDLPFVREGGCKVRILVGDWGYGKTHLLALL